ncbi:MAG: hydrogenase expression protein HypE [Alphaproteobacteria bacterium]|nr:hydrogenase expression protein HypE [Alphaproteobacteria bacterium]
MSALADLLAAGRRVAGHRPWPRIEIDRADWERATALLGDGTLALSGLWGDAGAVHMAVATPAFDALAVVTLACPDGTFPSVGRVHAPAIRLERAAADLFGLVSIDAPDPRPWLDHGRFPTPPLGRSDFRADARRPYVFLPVEGEGLHQIPVGPVHAGIIEPGHFRFTANGETVVRLEQRLGYVHKGIDALMSGATLERAARLAGRVSGDSTVAYAIAFAHAVEAALGDEAPPRAQALRAVMAELERIANHLGDIGAVCNDASFSLMHAHCGVLRERVLRAAASCFGHRLMMDRVVPGGVATDLAAAGAATLRALLAEIGARFPELVAIYDGTASLQDRTVGTGIVGRDLVMHFAAGGHVGRASGRAIDVRRTPGYPPYDRLAFDVPVLESGDVDARVLIRMREIEASRGLIARLLDDLPAGPVARTLDSAGGGEGLALAEAFRGDVLVWVRIEPGGRVARAFLRDASWFQWPLLEAAIEGNIVADFPLCNKSFNCSYSGHDL